jgi:hypothetical protein
MRTIWFGPVAVAAAATITDDGIATAADAAGVRAILARWGLPALSTPGACHGASPCG